MPDAERQEAKMISDWLTASPVVPNRAPSDTPAALVRAVLDRVAADEHVELPPEIVYASVLQLMAARTELDRLELGLMRAASDQGNSWSWIAEAFGHRSRQAAHARASALQHRLEYRIDAEDETR